ncbi:MAG: tyrosine-type recombinase/integrase [Ktedonobacteraceae bacterium]
MTNPRKRSVHGGGSIYQRKSDGRYVASIKDPETGKYITRYGQTEKEAYNLLEDIKRDIRQNALTTGPRQTVGKYLQDWFENIQKQEVRNTTYWQQKRILDVDILPVLGHIPLLKLTPQHIQQLYTDKMKAGWKATTIRNIHKILHKALKNAVRWRWVPQNVCDLVSLPRQVKHKAQVLTKEQTVQLLKASQGHQLEPLIVLGLGLGMRHGEIAALRWQDVNFEKSTLEVKRTVSLISGQGYLEGEPKTEKSKRTIVLPRFVIRVLEQHLARQQELRVKVGPQWQDLGLVLSNPTGGYRNPAANVRCFDRLLKRIGLPSIRIHDLRHSAATLLAAKMKMPANLVQDLLGHDNIEMTLGLYTHSDLEMQRQMMADLDTFLGGDLS